MPDDHTVALGPFLTCRVGRTSDIAVVALFGEFDLAAEEPVRSLVNDVEATDPRALVMDLAGLTFLDSSGARALIDVHHRSLGLRPFAVVRGTGPAHRALTMMGIDELLTMISSVDELSDGSSTGGAEAAR